MEYQTIAEKAVREMNAQEVQHFLVVCALVSDLHCPGYNPRQALRKDTNLARTAFCYKIDTAKASETVREELSKPVNERTLKKNKTTETKSK
jgi:hypothetical protein